MSEGGQIVTTICAGSGETGDMSSSSVETELGIFNGKWREAQTGDKIKGQLLQRNYEVSGQYRIQVESKGVAS